MIERVARGFDTAAARTARAWLAAMNAHDAVALRALLAEDFTWVDAAASDPATPLSRPGCGHASAAAAVDIWVQWFAATPDLSLGLVGEFDGEDWAIRQLRFLGTRRRAPGSGPAGATPDATARVDQPGCVILTVHADRITQLWIYRDASETRSLARPRPQADF